MEVAFADVAFPELERSISWVTTQPPVFNGSFDLVAPRVHRPPQRVELRDHDRARIADREMHPQRDLLERPEVAVEPRRDQPGRLAA